VPPRTTDTTCARTDDEPLTEDPAQLLLMPPLAARRSRQAPRDDRRGGASRHVREVFGSLTSGSEPTISTGTASSTGLPLNRKEQYYTATVLPMIIASDGFAYLHRFLDLCGLPVGRFDDHGRAGNQKLQFFTEYNLAESLRDDDRHRFPDPRSPIPGPGTTPLTSCSPVPTGF